ncbi:unnamed protein product [Diabrotica balteata]|uniref:Myrosinase 1-like n=1 Tax=Diabrotica balteata TaxID=107213 RepID=A0A9N9X6U1_DIABA|nr:unnamed protein product [Diabrotica balteata]
MKVILISLLLGLSLADDPINNKKFPDDFLFGVASSAYQVEGGWNEDGKGESIWDHRVHTDPNFIEDHSTGDVACDSYHKIKEDIAMLKELGVNHYRFSLSWTRILPTGVISITLDTSSYLPASNKTEDIDAADRMQHFSLGVYANPIYVGDYPEIVKTRVAERSKAEGRAESRLPTFTQEEVEYIKGTHDFFGLNVYTGYLVADLGYDPPVQNPPSKWQDEAVNAYQPPEWENTTVFYTKVVPWTARYLVNWIKDKYNNPGIIITENGYPSYGDKDDRRIYYIRGYLSALRDAMEKDNVTIFGYTVWSVMDNFEWTSGFGQKFGLYEVDFSSLNRSRTARPSAMFYKNVIATRCLVETCTDV